MADHEPRTAVEEPFAATAGGRSGELCDPGPPPITTLFGIGRPKTPPALNEDGRRRAGDYVVAAARIKVETASRSGDLLNGSDHALADSWLEAATRALDDNVPTVIGNELMPTSLEPEKDIQVVTLKNTVSDPHYVTADASRDRVQLALDTGALELALDLADTVQAENSLEKMLVHQLAANHRSVMKLSAQLNRCVEDMNQPYRPEAQERANVQGTRIAGAIARMQGTFQSGMLALQKMRSGGQQTVRVVHQHVTVGEGAQAVVAGEMNTTGKPAGGGARRPKRGGRDGRER
jgi:NADH dehydrogenase/NADH:ubiquinone oxidoreductase subunit G